MAMIMERDCIIQIKKNGMDAPIKLNTRTCEIQKDIATQRFFVNVLCDVDDVLLDLLNSIKDDTTIHMNIQVTYMTNNNITNTKRMLDDDFTISSWSTSNDNNVCRFDVSMKAKLSFISLEKDTKENSNEQ